MNNALIDHLAKWLGELNLPEPEISYPVLCDGKEWGLDIAYPDHRLGVILDETTPAETIRADGWIIYICRDMAQVRTALSAMGDRLGTAPNVISLDFTIIETLFNDGLYSVAKEKLDSLQATIHEDHPDWPSCENWGSQIRKALRKQRRTQKEKDDASPSTAPLPDISAATLLEADARRISSNHLPAHNFLGLFTPVEQIETGDVDAVWVANVDHQQTTLWAATVAGHPTYKSDPGWQMVDTDITLLTETLNRLGEQLTFIWNSELVIPALRAWHFRAFGVLLPDTLQWVDLRALCLVVFPTARRTDQPESLCREQAIAYQDAAGNGGYLAAMTALLQSCVDKLQSFPAPLQTALKEVLAFPVWSDRVLNYQKALKYPALPINWLDILLPLGTSVGFKDYLEHLENYYKDFPLPIQYSAGKKNIPLTVTSFFRNTGYLAQIAGKNYKERTGQIEFAHKVAEATCSAVPYILEAGTGVGKTIGYLVPLLLSGKRCFVSTHTKNLQDQAWTKDVPAVLKAFSQAGIQGSVAVLKGKNNYVCLQTVVDQLENLNETVTVAQEAWEMAGLLHWLLKTKTGWLNEIENLGSPAFISRLGRDQAPPVLDQVWAECDPHTRAQEASESADVVLVNHSYVFALAQNQSISDVDVLLFDEAHNIEDVATEALTMDFAPWALQTEIASLLKRDRQNKVQGLLRSVLEHPAVNTVKTLQAFNAAFLDVETKITTWCQMAIERLAEIAITQADDDPELPMLFPLELFWGQVSGQLGQALYQSGQELQVSFVTLAAAAGDLIIELPHLRGLPKQLSASLSNFLKRLQENKEGLQNLVINTANNQVHWGEATICLDEEGIPRISGNTVLWHATFHSTPLDIAVWLRETLPPLYPHQIYVSATMAVQSDFSGIKNRLGLTADADDKEPVTAIFNSPFNFAQQVLLAVPSDTPTPRASFDPLYIEALSANIAQLAQVSKGRTLVLFTSRRAMREVGVRLQTVLNNKGITTLTQSNSNRTALIERFREAPDQGEQLVLLGLRTFWEGVDVPGDALQMLVITRLPFDYAGHPVALARKEYYLAQGFDLDYFHEVIIPATYLHLRQMYGRLIRKEDDRGICVILDPRIYTTRYGKYLLDSLPGQKPVVQKRDVLLERIKQFLGGEPLPEEPFDLSEPADVAITLSKEQQAIIDSLSNRILVRAAAGSGKTSVLTRRIIKLVESGQVQPDKILALTFTNKAQTVMVERIETQLGSKAFDLTKNILTYHKLAGRIIRQDDRGTGQVTKFLNESNPEQQSKFLEYARQKAGLRARDLSDEDALTVISYAQNGLVDEAELAQEIPQLEAKNPYLAQLARFFLAYVERLRRENLIDYGEAIVKAVRILRQDPRSKQMWSGRFEMIFCDEYQDTTPAQSALLSLVGQHKALFVVGDSAQSIYSWQGADPDNLRRFEIDFPNTSSFSLNRNYRCFPKLVAVSNHFLERCSQTHGIKVVYDEKRSNEVQNVYYLTSDDDWDEAKAIATLAGEVLQLQTSEDPPQKGTVGVLARKWQLLNALEIALIKQELPYQFEGDTARGLSAGTEIQSIIKRAVDLLEWGASDRPSGDSPDGKAVTDIRAGKITLATELLDRAQKVLGSEPPAGNTQYRYQQLLHIFDQKAAEAIVKIYGNNTGGNKIVLSTVHSQKGEEFDTVFVVGLEKDNTPHKPPTSHAKLIQWRRVVQQLSHATWRTSLTDDALDRLYEQEEQRIFYVAMTRARLNLVICRAEIRNLQPFKQSEFLEQARVQDAIKEVTGIYNIALVTSAPQTPQTNYHSQPEL